jgi:uncharacterized delta-60 repeat protein
MKTCFHNHFSCSPGYAPGTPARLASRPEARPPSSPAWLAALLLLAGGGLLSSRAIQPGALDPSFAPEILTDGTVNSVAVQTNGSLVIGGLFTRINGQNVTNLARLQADGQVDPTFVVKPGEETNAWELFASSWPVAVTVRDDSTVLVATVRNQPGRERGYLFRFLADGTLDPGFTPAWVADMADPWDEPRILGITTQPDGKILIVGHFNRVMGAPRLGLARLNDDGTLDSAFSPVLDLGFGRPPQVETIALQPDGNILVGGASFVPFVSFNGQMILLPVPLLVRLQPDGALDDSFSADVHQSDQSSLVRQLQVLSDNRILVAKDGMTVLMRLLPDGRRDESFQSTAVPPLAYDTRLFLALAHYSKGRIFLGGTVYGFPASQCLVLRLLENGLPDGTFQTQFSPSSTLTSLAPASNGQVVVAGHFTEINGVSQRTLARLALDGRPDALFRPAVQTHGQVQGLLAAPDEKLFIWGEFTSVDGATRHNLARLNADGSVDAGFDPGRLLDTNEVNYYYSQDTLMAVLPEGKLVLVRPYTWPLGFGSWQSGHQLLRLNQDGTVDSAFAADPVLGNRPSAIHPQPDGNILLGWDCCAPSGFQLLTRLLPNGIVDPSFVSPPVASVRALATQSDGKILVVGRTNYYSYSDALNLIRLLPDGTQDGSFQSPVAIDYSSPNLLVQPDDKILLVANITASGNSLDLVRLSADGAFDTTIHGPFQWGSVHALALQPDQNILAAGVVRDPDGLVQRSLWRFYSDGAWDGNFSSALTNAEVHSLVVQADGKIVAAGAVITPEGALLSLVRLHGGDPEAQPPSLVFHPLSQTLLEGETARFTGFGRGFPPPTYQWQHNGVDLPGATNTAWILPQAVSSDSGDYTVILSNSSGSATSRVAHLTVIATVSLAGALDNDTLVWSSWFSGQNSYATNGGWFGQANLAHDQLDAAQARPLDQPSAANLETTLPGPGTLTFWWKVSSESSYDFLQFFLDDLLLTSISGESDWAQQSFRIASPQRARWTYVKDDSLTSGADTAWLDEVVFVPDPVQAFGVRIIGFEPSGDLHLLLQGESGRPYTIQASPDLTTWTTLTNVVCPPEGIHVVDPVAMFSPQRFYRAVTP